MPARQLTSLNEIHYTQRGGSGTDHLGHTHSLDPAPLKRLSKNEDSNRRIEMITVFPVGIILEVASGNRASSDAPPPSGCIPKNMSWLRCPHQNVAKKLPATALRHRP